MAAPLGPEGRRSAVRPIDADDFRTNGDGASDFSNLRQNGLVRITLALPPKVRLVDPATNAVSNETYVDVWRMVPSVNNVALTGPDFSIPCGRATPTRPVAISWTPASRRCRNRPSGRSSTTRRFRGRLRNGSSTTCPRFSGCCSRTIGFARCPTQSERARPCLIRIRSSTSSSSRERPSSCVPAASATGGPGSRPRRSR